MTIGRSINPPVPDFRSAGTLSRIVLAANLPVLIVGLARAVDWAGVPALAVDLAGLAEPPLAVTLAALYLLQPWLRRVGWIGMSAAVLALSAAAATGLAFALDAQQRALLLPGGIVRALAWSLLTAVLVLQYLYLRSKALGPALAEARLDALSARIRPHFFFNSLNAVLGILRTDARRAETALEELSELFRAVMRDSRELTTLGAELALCRQYLDLERLRLGERLRVDWRLDGCPEDAAVPPLMLQPLLENAVYHGIEPSTGPAGISIAIFRQGEAVHIELTNPSQDTTGHRGGNRMALDNIRERLALFFDFEAALTTETGGGLYRVSIRIPYRRVPR